MAQILINMVVLGSIYVLFTIGLSLAWGVLDVLNLAHGAIFMAGAFSAWAISQWVVLPLVVLLPVSALAGGVVAVALEFLAYRPIRNRARGREEAELATLIASVGFGAAIVAAADRFLRAEAAGLPSESVNLGAIEMLSLRVTWLEILIVSLALGAAILLAVTTRRAQVGRALRATAFNPTVASIVGVPVRRVYVLTMLLCGSFAGLGGLLLAAQRGGLNAYMGESLLLRGFAIVIVGSVGNIWGTLIAAFALAGLETATAVYLPGDLTTAVAFLVILLVLTVKPEGLFTRVSGDRV